ncbi:hypothetical protein HAZT_HAZT003083 [Hyalella azteca]|uniref:C3H1-type domain-containing protein n=1 Tax=Hyalella azteca TaxID=294128 RepID=A0A6A0GW85_HYAAZ|nr:hypothetical protein HAZT_HAZT003083 [Hyalella azteca]
MDPRLCNYAHGLDQLKVSFHHGKYKTRNCQAYHESGYCRYGARCSFIHDLEEGILKCSIANKEVASYDRHSNDTLLEFTAIPSLRPADVDSIESGSHDNVSRIYTLDAGRLNEDGRGRIASSYKKKKCYSFHQNGFCLYGPYCHFLHDED